MQLPQVNEGSEFAVTAAPRDEDNLPITPTGMRYRIDCLSTGTQVLDWTSISVPAETNEIVVPGSLATIVDSCSARERKQMVIETTNPKFSGLTRESFAP